MKTDCPHMNMLNVLTEVFFFFFVINEQIYYRNCLYHYFIHSRQTVSLCFVDDFRLEVRSYLPLFSHFLQVKFSLLMCGNFTWLWKISLYRFHIGFNLSCKFAFCVSCALYIATLFDNRQWTFSTTNVASFTVGFIDMPEGDNKWLYLWVIKKFVQMIHSMTLIHSGTKMQNCSALDSIG